MLPVIAGVVGRDGRRDAWHDCSSILNAMSRWNGGAQLIQGDSEAALGVRGGHRPCRSANGEWLLTASARLDDRAGLLRDLRIEAGAEPAPGDQELLLLAWLRWRERIVDHLTGDAAFAVLHLPSRAVWLGRSALALRSLFFRVEPGTTAFASHPAGLFGNAGTTKRLNLEHAALMAAQYSFVGSPTIFAGVERVCPGEVVKIAAGKARPMHGWRPTRHALPVRSADEAAEAIRGAFDQAVGSMVRGDERIAAQLSSGRDSSAVVTAAAKVLQGQGRRLLALTGAPAESFDGPSFGERIADEAALAATTVAPFANVDHQVCRPKPGLALDWLRTLNQVHHQPVTNFGNAHWWIQLHEAAAAAQTEVMLTGAVGNFTISAGPVEHLIDVLREDLSAKALRLASLMPGRLGALRVLAGALLPGFAYAPLLQALRGGQDMTLTVPVLQASVRRAAEGKLRADSPPIGWGSGFDLRSHMLLDDDAADPIVPALWGMETRDPTGDRRVVEACFGVPARYLVPQRGDPRPLYRLAFGGRVPAAVVRGERRGYQGADWFGQFPVVKIRERFLALLANPAVAELFDRRAITELLDQWPTSQWSNPQVLHTYRGLMLNALAIADFIDLHWPA